MNPIDLLKELLSTFSKKAKYKDREMKRVFQWRRYLEWEDLSKHEKLAAKRLLFVPIGAYYVFTFIHQYTFIKFSVPVGNTKALYIVFFTQNSIYIYGSKL